MSNTNTTSNTSNSASLSASAIVLGNALWQKQVKTNAELLALTYGAMVAELLRDLELSPAIEAELDRMGHSMGIRCMEEFLAKSALELNNSTGEGASSNVIAAVVKNRSSFTDTALLLQASLKMFLGTAVDVSPKSETSYTLQLTDNPLQIFVELPSGAAASGAANDSKDYSQLQYSQLLCGMVRGMLEMLQYDVTCQMIKSPLHGDTVNEMVVDLKQVLQEGAGEEYHEE